MALTDTAIKSAKSASKPFKLADEKGLYLLIQPSGGKLWRFEYCFDGKRKTIAFGGYPDVNLKQARTYRDEARQQVANGTDPGEVRKQVKSDMREKIQEADEAAKIEALIRAGEPLPGSFEEVAREWFASQEIIWAAAHAEKVINRLKNNVFPWIGSTIRGCDVDSPVRIRSF